MNITAFLIRKAFFPLMEKLKGNQIRSYVHELLKTEKLSEEQLKEYRTAKLKNLLVHCVHHVPAYKPYKNLLPLIEENPELALRQFPILTKQYFKQNRDEYKSDITNDEELILNRTGGSTGEPMTFYMDRFTVEHYEAARWRSLFWHHIQIGDPHVMVWNSPIEGSQLKSKKNRMKERILKNKLFIPADLIEEAHISRFVDEIHRFKPAYLYGYASSLTQFAKQLRDLNISLNLQLKGVVSTAEMLYDDQRKLIEEVLRCKVINEYGARDGGMIAYECPAKEMHIQAENVWLETVDIESNELIDSGEVGSLLITDLNNFVMPRLRYQIGDMGILSNRTCSCGRSLPLMDQLEGRTDEILQSKTGQAVSGRFFSNLLNSMKSISQFQVIQHSLDHLTIRLVSNEQQASKEEVESLIPLIKKKMGDPKINIEFVDRINPRASGKLRTIIKECN